MLSHCSAHVVNLLLRDKWKSIPNFLSGESFQKCNPPDFKFYLGKLINKFSPYGVMLNSLCFIVLFNAVKTDTKLTLHRMGKCFII